MAKVKHIALLRFKEGTGPEQIDKSLDDLLELSETVEGIEDYVAGEYSSSQGMNKGFTHAFVMTFTDAAARDAYLTRPERARVVDAMQTLLEDKILFDFEV